MATRAVDQQSPEPAPVSEVSDLSDGGAGGSDRALAPLSAGAEALQEFRVVLAEYRSANNAEPLMQNGDLPRVTLESDRQQPPPLTEDQKFFARFYQQRLLDNLALFTPPGVDFPKLLRERSEKIKAEMERGDFGPDSESRKAFAEYLQWMQQKAVPALIAEMVSAGVPLPPGTPIVIPMEDGKRISIDEYINRILTGKLSLDLKIDPNAPPGMQEAQRIEDTVDWMGRAGQAIKDARLAALDTEIERLIKERGLPKSWLFQGEAGADRTIWRAAVTAMLDTTLRTGRYIDIIQKLHLPIALPPGVRTERQPDGSTRVLIDLPTDGRLNDPANLRRMREQQKWQEQIEPLIKRAIEQLQVQPHEMLAWGDLAIPNVRDARGREVSAQARFGPDGTLTGIIDPSRVPLKPGETAQNLNLLEQRFTARRLANGDIEVVQSVQAQTVPFYGYLNMGAESVGKPANLPTRTLKPDEIVAVKTSTGVEFMLAKDLPTFADTQRNWHYGEKIVTAAMDGTMLLIGAVEVAAAIKGARVALSAAEIAAGASRGPYAGRLVKGLFDMGLGLTGVIGNASWSETEAGRLAGAIRGGLFVATAGAGIVNIALAMRAARFTKTAEGIHVEDIGALERWSHRGMAALQVPMAPMVGSGLYEQIKELWKDPHALATAIYEYGNTPDRRPVRLTDGGNDRSGGQPDPPGTADAFIANLKKTLTDNLPRTLQGDYTRDEVTSLLNRLSRAVRDGTGRDALIKELTANVSFNISDIRRLQRTYGTELTAEQIRDLQDPAKRAGFPEPVRKLAEELMAQKDQTLVTASQIALLYLVTQTGRNADGTMPADLGAVNLHLPPQYVGQTSRIPQLLGARDVEIGVDTQSLIEQLQSRLAAGSADGQAIAISGALLKVGGISPQQFAAVLQSVLANPNASAADKLNALSDAGGPRMAALISGLRLTEYINAHNPDLSPEQRAETIIRSYGTTSRDLEASLGRTATGDADAKVRAAAALMLYGLTRLYSSSEEGTRILAALDALVQRHPQPGTAEFVKESADLILNELKVSSPDNVQQRVDAARILSLLAARADEPERRRIQSEVAQALTQSLLQTNTELTGIEQTGKLLSALTPELVANLRANNPERLAAVQAHVLSLLTPPEGYDADREKQLIELMKSAPVLFQQDGDQSARLLFNDAATRLLETALPVYSALRSATIDALAAVNDPASLPLLQKLAASDPYPAVRQSAIAALEKMGDPSLGTVVERLIATEADPAVARLLRAVRGRLDRDGSLAAAELTEFQRATWERYPHLKSFDVPAQQTWLKEHFPLLDRETFVKQILQATAGQDDDEMAGQRFGDQVAADRDAQFRQLVELALGNAEDEKTQQARLVLLSLITGGISPAGNSKPILIGQSITTTPNGLMQIVNPVYYGEKRNDWSLNAARALAESMQPGKNGRDLSRLLITIALGSGVSGLARDLLQKTVVAN